MGLSRKFKAPPSTDIQQWKKIAYLVEHGLRFQTLPEPYPATLAEAKTFVELYGEKKKLKPRRPIVVS